MDWSELCREFWRIGNGELFLFEGLLYVKAAESRALGSGGCFRNFLPSANCLLIVGLVPSEEAAA